MEFFAELRRRSVFRVAAVYLVTAWLIMQVVAVAMGALELPGWVDGFVFVILAAGLPVTLVIAWAFEVTPEGVRRTAPSSDAPRNFAPTDLALIAALVAVLGVSLYQVAQSGGRPQDPAGAGEELRAEGADARESVPAAPAATDGIATLAVLPFLNMSNDPDQEYFSDGLSEELMNVLARIRDLRVTGRTSAFAFKGRNVDLREIGETLGVAHILEGSVRKSGDRLRITAQLISAADGYHLWSETYDRELTDVFAVQDEIAMAVADALSIALGVGDIFDVGGTQDVEAYDLYLQGIAAARDANADGYLRARGLLRQAVARDPAFAVAWLELGEVNAYVAAFAPEQAASALEDAGRSLSQAVALLPEGYHRHSAEALRQWIALGDLASAAVAFAEAQESASPGGVRTLGHVSLELLNGVFLETLGRQSDAAEIIAMEVVSNPLSPSASLQHQFILDSLGRHEAAEAELQRFTEQVAPSVPMEFQKLQRLWLTGAPPGEVRAQYDRFVALDGGFLPLNAAVGPALDDPAAARALLSDAIDDPFYEPFSLMNGVAQWAAMLGHADIAFDALRRAHVGTNSTLLLDIWHPVFADLRHDPRFKAIVHDAGIYDAWRATGEWSDFCRPLGEDDFECF